MNLVHNKIVQTEHYLYFTKNVVVFIFPASVCWSSSIHYYGWTPNRELVYHFESQILTGVPKISESQNSGVMLTSDIRIQSFSDYSLRVKFDNTKIFNFNGEVHLSESGHLNNNNKIKNNTNNNTSASTSTNNNNSKNIFNIDNNSYNITHNNNNNNNNNNSSSSSNSNNNDKSEVNGFEEVEIADEFKDQLETSFVVHLKEGIVQSFFVSANEPTSITNIKRSLMSQLQLDIGGASHGPADINESSYSSSHEESLLGDCQTDYTIQQLPSYMSNKLEDSYERNNTACKGQEIFEILKNTNLDNCAKRSFLQNNVGIESQCDGSKSACADQFSVSVIN